METKTATKTEEIEADIEAPHKDKSVTATNENLPSFSKLLSLARPEQNALFFAILLMIFAEATGLVTPMILADAYNDVIDLALDSKDRMSRVNTTMIKVLLVQSVGIVAGFARAAIMAAAGERVVARLRTTLYERILMQEVAFFDETKSGELISRLGSDTTLVQVATSTAIPEVILGLMKVIVCIFIMFFISAKLAGLSLVMIFVLFFICIPFGKKMGQLSKSYQDVLAEAQTYSTEALGNVRTIVSFAAESREGQLYRDSIGEPDKARFWIPDRNRKTTYSVGLAKGMVTAGFFTTTFGFGFMSMNICLWYGFKQVNDGNLDLGSLVAFGSYIFQIGFGLATTSNWISKVLEARGASSRLFALMEREPKIPSKNDQQYFDTSVKANHADTIKLTATSVKANHADTFKLTAKTPLKPTSIEGHIEFKNVSFAYPSRPDVRVLKSFSLTIPPNTTAALVGSSGAGKSTVVSILQRFYDVVGGSVHIDGNDIRSLDVKWLRQQIGYVQQEPQLFGLSVKENVCYGLDHKISKEEIINVCKEANAHDFIMQMPDGYDTMVGERGVKLSGGQKQRISIARALLVNPRILLLDEATSALDAESEHLVQQAIERAVAGRTVVIVAHRLSTIKHASQIVVLDDHEVVDVGTHDMLQARCKKYQELTKRQSTVVPSLEN